MADERELREYLRRATTDLTATRGRLRDVEAALGVRAAGRKLPGGLHLHLQLVLDVGHAIELKILREYTCLGLGW